MATDALVQKSLSLFSDEEVRIARVAMNVRDVLQQKAVTRNQTVLDVDETYAELVERFGKDTLSLLGWGDMYMMDMMYFKRGGNYRMDQHNRPKEGDLIYIGGVLHGVYETSLFTFSAEQQFDTNSDDEQEAEAA